MTKTMTGCAIAGQPHLDIFTLSQVWALVEALHGVRPTLARRPANGAATQAAGFMPK